MVVKQICSWENIKKSPRNYSTEAHECKFLSNQKKTRTVFNVHKSKLSKLKPFVKQGEAKKGTVSLLENK